VVGCAKLQKRLQVPSSFFRCADFAKLSGSRWLRLQRGGTTFLADVMPEKRVWSEVERAEWKAGEIQKEHAKRALVQSIASGWNSNQRRPFKTDFLGRYACKDIEAANIVRKELGIEVQSDASAPGLTPAPMQSWAELSILPSWIEKSLREHNWDAPMPIQAQALPILLGGRNLIGIAQTGSGKTLAFMLPAVIHAHDQQPLEQNDQGPIVLVLAPTRELAVQISEETEKLTKYSWESWGQPSGLRSTCFYGGGKKMGPIKEVLTRGFACCGGDAGPLARLYCRRVGIFETRDFLLFRRG